MEERFPDADERAEIKRQMEALASNLKTEGIEEGTQQYAHVTLGPGYARLDKTGPWEDLEVEFDPFDEEDDGDEEDDENEEEDNDDDVVQ